jgi:hypothetical protein
MTTHHFARKWITVFLPILILAAVSIGLVTVWVDAQNPGQGLEVSPPSQELDVNPGTTQTIRATIRNKSNETLPIQARIEDFIASGEEGQVALTEDGPWAIASWTTITPSSFSLGPNEEQEVTATIQIPNDGVAGGRYGSFVFGVATQESGEQGVAQLSQEVASLFLLKVAGAVDESMILSGFSAPKYSEYGPIPFELKFENKGNVHVKTYGLINVTNIFGQKVADVVVPGTNVFPGASRVVRAELDKKFLIGPHTAIAVMYYGSVKNETLTETTTFFVFPARIAGIVIGVVVILYLLRKRLKKAFKALLTK